MNPPVLHEHESERSYLSHLLIKGAAGGTDFGLAEEDFHNQLHRKIFASILEITDKGIAVDPISLTNQLRETGRFSAEDRETEYIFNLYKNAIIVQPLSYYIKRIKKLSDRRKYLETLTAAAQNLAADPEENEVLFTKIESDLSRISKAVSVRGLRLIKEYKEEMIEYIKLMYETKGATIGLKTHFHELDEATTGLKSGELMILAARPGNGKTTFALNIASNVAVREKKAVAIFSLEMGYMELLTKMVCSEARINSTLLKTGSIHPGDQSKLLNSILALFSSSVYIDDTGALTIWEFKNRIRQLLITTPLSLIVVDYLQLMSDPTAKEGGRQQEVASISRNLKQMAKEAGCPILALSQMSRAVEQRSKDQRPQLSDLRESGAIEQDADIVAFIYRPDLVNKDDVPEDKRNKAEIIIAKNRAGAIKTFELIFTPEYSRFDNI